MFVRSLLEYAGVCLNFPGSGQVGLSGCGPVGVARMRSSRGRPDEGRSGSTGFDRMRSVRVRLASTGYGPSGSLDGVLSAFERMRPIDFDRMRALGVYRMSSVWLSTDEVLRFHSVGPCADAVWVARMRAVRVSLP